MRSQMWRLFISVLAFLTAPGAALACDPVGVLNRIEGRPQEVVITRSENSNPPTVFRPRVLQVLCHNDIVHVTGATSVMIAVDGRGVTRVEAARDYTLPSRMGASITPNLYQELIRVVMPDMQRIVFNASVRGPGEDFDFALPALAAGGQLVRAGKRDLLFRLVGGQAPFELTIRDASGQVVAEGKSDDRDIILKDVALAPGLYRVMAADGQPSFSQASFNAVADAPPHEGGDPPFATTELSCAVDAILLAKKHPQAWSFEAEQELAAVPPEGIDRERVYELIESYSEK
jgi:hypothetical protein